MLTTDELGSHPLLTHTDLLNYRVANDDATAFAVTTMLLDIFGPSSV
jgi:hypothetical protein